jgi:hypothetical protein
LSLNGYGMIRSPTRFVFSNMLLQELLSEMDEFNSAAAAGTVKPKNMHNPACECIVCTNRRRYEERKQQEAAESARAAAAAAGASEEEQVAAAAAAAAAVASSAAAAAEAAEGKPPPPKGEVRDWWWWLNCVCPWAVHCQVHQARGWCCLEEKVK